MGDVLEFLIALVSRWADWLTGGVLIALVWVYEKFLAKTPRIPQKKFAAVILSACFVGANFSVWKDQRDAKIEFQHRLAETKGSEPLYIEVPAGIINGINPTFMLSKTPADPSRVRVYEDRMRQMPGTDYKIEGRTITFLPDAIPPPGAVLLVEY